MELPSKNQHRGTWGFDEDPFPVNEIDDSMINDLISTTLGGMALGEMSHRLYAEAERNGSILRLGGLFLHEMSLLKACL